MIFLDTSFIIAYYNTEDVHHEKASQIMERIISQEDTMIILEHIFDEVVNVLINRLKNLNKIKLIGEDIKNFTKIIHTERDDFEKSWKIFKEQKNTKFSFTDCAIVSILKERKIKNLVTFDKEFLKVKEINVVC